MTTIMLLVIILAITAPLILYIREGWKDRSELLEAASGEEDTAAYFTAGRTLTIDQYAATTVAYGLQMAAFVLFAQWGYYYGYWAFLVPIAWCIGFLLLAWAARRLNGFLQSTQTLHGFLGDKHGGQKRVIVLVAALATLLGLGGALFAELGYISALVQNLLAREDTFRYLLMFFFLASVLVYALPRGFRAVVDTDKRQLPIAYVGLAIFLSSIIYVGHGLGVNTVPSTLIGILAFIVIAITSLAGIVSSKETSNFYPAISIAIPVISLGCIISAYFLGDNFPPTPQVQIPVNDWDPQPMSVLTAISLLLANALWQFVDLSAFQRLTALKLGQEAKDRVASLRKAIIWTALESPISWCIGIAIGVGLGSLGVFGGQDGAWSAYETFMVDLVTGKGAAAGVGQTIRLIVVGGSLTGMIAVMLSTVDSLGNAVAFTTSSDIFRAHTAVSRRGAQISTVVVLVFVWSIFAVWQSCLSEQHDISGWLYTTYAMQLSLLGVCVCALFDVALRPWVALTSVGSSVCLSAATGAYLVNNGDPNVFVLPPIVAVVSSFIVVLPSLIADLVRNSGGGR